jgi:hypothetical protein
VDIPIVYYLNRIDYWWIGWQIDSDSTPLYMLNLLVLGLYLATPQLMLATVGGLVMRWAGSSTRLRAFAMRSPRERIGNPDGKLG